MRKNRPKYYARMFFDDGACSQEMIIPAVIELIASDPVVNETACFLIHNLVRKRGTMVIAGNGEMVFFDVDLECDPVVSHLSVGACS